MPNLFNSYYQCGGKKFFNIYQAFHEQKRTGDFPSFVVDKDLIQNLGTFKRPKNYSRQHLHELMVKRLKELRSKYKTLKLAYGGGTDGYTIVRLCVENDIYIDETVTQMCSAYGELRTNIEPLAGLKAIRHYEGKQIGKITELHPTEKDLGFVDKPEWFCDPSYVAGPNLSLRYHSLPHTINTSMHGEKDAIMLTGFEKPSVRVDNGKIFWYMNDHSIGDQLGIHNTIPFFLDKDNPDLVVGLAYAYLDAYTSVCQPKQGDYLTFESINKTAKSLIFDRCGYYLTPYNFINMHLLGKTHFAYHRKNRRFISECRKHGNEDYIKKMFRSHKKIAELFGDLPHAIETKNGLVKSVGRLGPQLEMQ